MKNLLFIFAISMFIFSCGDSSQQKQEDKTGGSSFLQDEEVYDPKIINPDAPITEVSLTATGNTMTEMKFDKKEIRVPAGCTVKLSLINQSTDTSMQHNFVLIEKDAVEKVGIEGVKAGVANNFVPDLPEVLVASRITMPGESLIMSFPAPPTGEYKFICTYPGHYQMMQGSFVVE
jgi:azurin